MLIDRLIYENWWTRTARMIKDGDFREFLNEGVRGRQLSEIFGTPEDEDGEDFGVLRKHGTQIKYHLCFDASVP